MWGLVSSRIRSLGYAPWIRSHPIAVTFLRFIADSVVISNIIFFFILLLLVVEFSRLILLKKIKFLIQIVLLRELF